MVSTLPMPRRNIMVVGAGPAGLMAAEVLATAGHAVTIYERMAAPARKFLLAGRGGLNLTHSEPLDVFLSRYGSDADRIRQAVTAFPPARLIAWAEGLGQKTFTGSSGRVFPTAMKASPLLRAWAKRLDTLGVEIKTRHRWTGFAADGSILVEAPRGEQLALKPDALILALGGASWPRLGSDGSWVPAIASDGVAIAPLMPSNCGVRVPWTDMFAGRFSGAPLKRIRAEIAGRAAAGEAVITRSGLEGGVIYALGRAIREALQSAPEASLVLDLKPGLTAGELTRRLQRSRGSQSLGNFLRKATGLDAASIALLREAGPLPADSAGIAARIKALHLPLIGLAGLERAISTAGGVMFSGLTPQLMLKNRPGVFLAGEMLDWDAPTGGYLLQASFATGVAAAHGVLDWLADAAEPA